MGDQPTDSVASPSPSTGHDSPDALRAVVASLEQEGYRVVRSLGSGGMGVVFEAIQPNTHQRVAVKVARTGDHSGAHESALRREIESMAALMHPHIARVYAAGTLRGPGAEGRVYLVLEYIEDARTLVSYVREQRLSVADRLRLFMDVCAAAEFAIARGMVHGDIKAANVLVGAGGVARLTDFGLARRVFAGDRGVQGGTYTHMSPERRADPSGEFDEAGEVYALGVTLYETLTGDTPTALDAADRWEDRLTRRDSRLGGRLAGIVARATAPDRRSRTVAVRSLAREVERELRRPSLIRAASVRWGWTRGALVAAMIALAALTTMAAAPPVETALGSLNARFWAFTRAAERAGPAPLSNLEHVLIVAITDETDLNGLARHLGLDGVSTDNAKSLRRLHGVAQHRLAQAGPRAVVWDIAFRSDTEFDADFASGVRALRARNIGVVVTTSKWEYDAEGVPAELSRTIWASGPLWGSLHLVRATNEMLFRPLAVQRDALVALPSIVTAGYAAAVGGSAYFECRVVEATDEVELRWFRSPPNRPDQRVYLSLIDRIGVSDVLDGREAAADTAKYGIHPSDRVAAMKVEMAPERALVDATIDYERLLLASPGELADLVGGRVVLIGDNRTAPDDYHDNIEGRDRVPGVQIVASSLEAVLQRHGKWIPTEAGSTLWLFSIAGLGAGAAMIVRRTGAARRRGAALAVWVVGAAGLVAACLGITLLVFIAMDVIISPVVLVFCAGLAMAFTSLVLLLNRPWSVFTTPFETSARSPSSNNEEALHASIA